MLKLLYLLRKRYYLEIIGIGAGAVCDVKYHRCVTKSVCRVVAPLA